MPALLLSRTFQIIAGVLTVPIVGIAIIGSSYTSPFLTHLTDVISGNSTQTVAALNAPNWSLGAPLAQPVETAAATTTGGTMASSTSLTFAVSALDGTGTTTISNTLFATTDASSSLLGAEAYEISWNAVPGATGYAIYFGPNAGSLNNYFLASSTNGVPNPNYYFASSTSGQFTGSYTNSDPTAFAFKLNPLGSSFLNGGNVGIGTTSPVMSLDVASGTIRAYSVSTSTCAASNDGALFYNAKDKHLYVCEAATWQIIK